MIIDYITTYNDSLYNLMNITTTTIHTEETYLFN